jgi:hypothetical protein
MILLAFLFLLKYLDILQLTWEEIIISLVFLKIAEYAFSK